MRRNVFKHPKAKLADLALCTAWMLFWLAAGIILCVWTDRANKAGSFVSSARDERNGFCAMAWLQFLLTAVLTGTAALLYTRKCQSVFDGWEEKKQQRKVAKEQKRLQGQAAKVAETEAASAASKQLAAAAPAPRSTAAAVGPAMGPAGPGPVAGTATGRAGNDLEMGRAGVPVSTNAATGGAHAGPNAVAGADNPFK